MLDQTTHHIMLSHCILILCAAIAAGAVNSIAGGGTLISFPTLIFSGVPALISNATNTMALFPGSASAFWQYRKETGKAHHYWLWLGVPSLVGGTIGAFIAIKIGDKAFEHLVPWLVLAATTLFVLQDPLRRRLLKDNDKDLTETSSLRTFVGVMAFQLVIAIYGGFFGAGIGILMLASLGFLGIRNIHKMNGLKNLAAVFINGAASVMFALKGQVDWPIAFLMMAGAIIGGYVGAKVAQKMPQSVVKNLIIIIGITIAAAMFVKEFHR